MTLLTSALFTMVRSARAGEAHMEKLDSTDLVRAFLLRQLQSAFPLTEREDGDDRVLFEGHANKVRFVGHLPIAERGGLQFLEIAPESDALTLGYREAWPDTPFGVSDTTWQRRELLPEVTQLRLAYFGAGDDDSPTRWTDEWRGHDRLPELIRVELRHGDESVLAFVAEVRVRTAVAQPALFRAPPDAAP
jgi:hypothetical protein